MKKNFLILCMLLALDSIPLFGQVSLPRPPMGWNSFDSYGVYLHEDAAFQNLYTMARDYRPFGYEYFTIDNGWFGEYRLESGTLYAVEKHASDVHLDAYGRLLPSHTYFPHGFDRLISECHRLGLKFGLHLMRGIPRKAVRLNTPIEGTAYHARDIADTSQVCSWCTYNYGVDMDRPGAQEYYNSVVRQLAAWGVDFIKYDDIVPYPREVAAVAKAIALCGRPIVLSLSPGNGLQDTALSVYRQADMLRVTADVWDTRRSILATFAAWKKWSKGRPAGVWLDMDMIPVGRLQLMSPERRGDGEAVALSGLGHTRVSRLSPGEQRIVMTLRALSASPLFIGGDLVTMDEAARRLLTNREMIAANQNGKMGQLLYDQEGIEAWQVYEKNDDGGWIGIFNLNTEVKEVRLSLDLLTECYNCQELYDVWREEAIDLVDELELRIPPYDVVFIRYR